jgi:hypothetical protein
VVASSPDLRYTKLGTATGAELFIDYAHDENWPNDTNDSYATDPMSVALRLRTLYRSSVSRCSTC